MLCLISRADLNTIMAIIGLLAGPLVVYLQWRANKKEKVRLAENAEKAILQAQVEESKRKAIEVGHEALVKQVKDLQDQNEQITKTQSGDTLTLQLLKAEMLPITTALKQKWVDGLIHPSGEFHEDDAIIGRVRDSVPLTLKEWDDLLPVLEKRAHLDSPHVDEMEKLIAQGLPIIIRIDQLVTKQVEQGTSDKITDVQLVTTTVKSTATKHAEEHNGIVLDE
jgi:type II secretory pathway pseudopilin PulG